MRLQTTGSAPSHRIYKSRRPLVQAKFPQRRIYAATAAKHGDKMPLKQETLTQMDFVNIHVFREQSNHPEEILDEDQPDEPRTKRQRTHDVPKRDAQLNIRRVRHYKHERVSWDRGRHARGTANNVQDKRQNITPKKRMPVGAEATAFEQKVSRKVVLGSPSNAVPNPPQTPRRLPRQEIPASESPASPGSQSRHLGNKQLSPLFDRWCGNDIRLEPKLPVGTKGASKIENGGSREALRVVNPLADAPDTPGKKNDCCPVSKELEGVLAPSSHGQWKHKGKIPSTLVCENSKSEISASDSENDGLEEQSADPCVAVESFSASMVENSKSTRDLIDNTFYRNPTSPSPSHNGGTSSPSTDIKFRGITGKTHTFESQRLSTQQLVSMAQRTMYSDVFVSLPSFQVRNLLSQTKDHDIRNWEYPVSVRRIWIYERRPASALKYMAVISPAKRPGEVEQTGGLGNAEFNIKKGGNWRAYEILELYELAEPLQLQTLIANEWLQGAPRKYEPVRPAVLETLMANLMPPIFTCVTQDHLLPRFLDIEEVGVRLSSTTEAVTQSEPLRSASFGSSFPGNPRFEEYISSTQQYSRPGVSKHYLSQATTTDLTPFGTQRSHCHQDIVWTSPTNLISSNTRSNSSVHHFLKFEDDAENSNQMSKLISMKKCEVLSQSCLNESAPGPPLFVRDSDDSDHSAGTGYG